jgi:hypothetical protein
VDKSASLVAARPRRSTLSLDAMTRALVALFALVGTAATIASSQESTSVGSDVAGDLFRRFVELRQSIGVGQHSDPRFFSREWLERSIRDALATRNEPEQPGLNWVEDSLLTSFALGLSEDTIYSYKLVSRIADEGDLEMHVSDCNSPSTITVKFVSEDGAWRVSGVKFDSTTSAKEWYRPDLVPIIVFAHIDPRDRSRYFNQSNLGIALGLDVKPKAPCAVKADSQKRARAGAS